MNINNENRKKSFEPGDLLTKMEVCDLFCAKLRISRDTYYKHIRPRLKFKSISNELQSYRSQSNAVERMPYTIAVGIMNKMTNNKQPGDPSGIELRDYMDTF